MPRARYTSEQRQALKERFISFLNKQGLTWIQASNSKYRLIVSNRQELVDLSVRDTGNILVCGHEGHLKKSVLAWARKEHVSISDSPITQELYLHYGHLLQGKADFSTQLSLGHIPPDARPLHHQDHPLAELASQLGISIYQHCNSPRFLITEDERIIAVGDVLIPTFASVIRLRKDAE